MPRTKIICTIGPATDKPEDIRDLIRNGMSIARLNFSHGTHENHKKKIDSIRQISAELDRPVAILQDLCGPKIRVGEIPEPGMTLKPGQSLTLTTESTKKGCEACVPVSYPRLGQDVQVGDRILLADGLMELLVEWTGASEIRCRVITGGQLTSHKGINLPDSSVSAAAVTEKDVADLLFGLANGVDYVALSFVRTAEDIEALKGIIRKEKRDVPVIAKIEKHEALSNIDAIMAAADGIMVARGDLGVEIPLENVPNIQKMLVKKANEAGKPVIIATQMLRSMVSAPRPTRAEAADVANAVFEGADAVMLSEETATGEFPSQAVSFMARIARSAEENFPHERYLKMVPKREISASVAHAACVLADHLDASAIIGTTRSGATARNISRFRPRPRLIALSTEEQTVRRLALYWGCTPRLVTNAVDMHAMMEEATRAAMATGLVSQGELVVITAGQPEYVEGTTNVLKVNRLGSDVL
jgi:pyruvate kinase